MATANLSALASTARTRPRTTRRRPSVRDASTTADTSGAIRCRRTSHRRNAWRRARRRSTGGSARQVATLTDRTPSMVWRQSSASAASARSAAHESPGARHGRRVDDRRPGRQHPRQRGAPGAGRARRSSAIGPRCARSRSDSTTSTAVRPLPTMDHARGIGRHAIEGTRQPRDRRMTPGASRQPRQRRDAIAGGQDHARRTSTCVPSDSATDTLRTIAHQTGAARPEMTHAGAWPTRRASRAGTGRRASGAGTRSLPARAPVPRAHSVKWVGGPGTRSCRWHAR